MKKNNLTQLLVIIQIVLIMLKMFNLIQWNWWQVLFPLLSVSLFYTLIVLIVAVVLTMEKINKK